MNNNNINDSSSSSIFSSVQPNNSSSNEVSEIISSVDIDHNNCIADHISDSAKNEKSGNHI